MEWFNPVEWLAWIYGKLFVGHEFVGFLAVMAIIAIPIGALWIRAIDKYSEESSAKESTQLSVEWHFANDARLPTDGRASILNLWELPAGGGGLSEISGVAGAPFLINRRSREYRITNYATATIFNVEISLHFVFKEALKDRQNPNQIDSGAIVLERDWLIRIPKIDPGAEHAFVFYGQNETNRFVSVSFPERATGQVVGSTERKAIELIKPGPDMFWFDPAS